MKTFFKLYTITFAKVRFHKSDCIAFQKFYKALAWWWPFKVETCCCKKYQKLNRFNGFYLLSNEKVLIVKLYVNLFYTNMLTKRIPFISLLLYFWYFHSHIKKATQWLPCTLNSFLLRTINHVVATQFTFT